MQLPDDQLRAVAQQWLGQNPEAAKQLPGLQKAYAIPMFGPFANISMLLSCCSYPVCVTRPPSPTFSLPLDYRVYFGNTRRLLTDLRFCFV
jgi:hypothetical protein